jgi:hypothetical protein
MERATPCAPIDPVRAGAARVPASRLDVRDLRSRLLLFLHLPKTAGSSLNRIIRRQYSRGAVRTVDAADTAGLIAEVERVCPAADATTRCVAGHMPFGLHRHVRRAATYITVLRHPVDRLVSHYYYVRSHPEHYLYEAVRSRRLDLESYVASGLSPELDNGMVRLLSSHGARSMAPVPATALSAAETNLREHFAAVGLTERFDESLLIFKRLLGWGRVCYLKENISQGRPSLSEIPAAARRAIERRNELDLALYDRAARCFDEQVRRVGLARRDIDRFHACNRAYATAWGPVVRVARRAKVWVQSG